MDSQSGKPNRLLLLGGAVLAALVVVVVAIVISQGGDDESSEPAGGGSGENGAAQGAGERQQVRAQFAGIPQSGVALGEPDAPATLIEFADLQCPFCAQFAVEVLPTVIDKYVRSGKLKLELRLLAFLGPDSKRGADVAAAATLQDRGWEYSELFFRNQGPENSGYATNAFLERLARATPGLDVRQVNADLGTPPARSLIRQARRQGSLLAVEGTPSFFIAQEGGSPQPLDIQSLDPDSFTQQLDDALAEG